MIAGKKQKNSVSQKRDNNIPGEARLDKDSIPPNVDLGLAEGTPRSAKESPLNNYTEVFLALPAPAFILDLDGNIKDVNRVFCRMSGFTREDLLDRPLHEFIELESGEETNGNVARSVSRFVVKAIESGQSAYDLEINCKKKVGGLIPVNLAGSPIFNEDGNIIGIVAIGHDLSDLKEQRKNLANAYKVIEDYNRSLDLKMTERVREMKQRARMLEELSITDELTKLFNRRYLFSRVTDEMQRSDRYGQPISIVTLDIDHFKRVNDTYGHQAGDMVLYELAGILRSSVRQVDVVARTGGEEFVILLPAVREGHAFIFCERLREKVKHFRFTSLPPDYQVTISLGVADYPRENIKNNDELINLSDRALYAAKVTRDATVTSSNL